jgi:hypothetical protein
MMVRDSDGNLDSDVAEPGVELDGDDKVTFNFDPGADDEGASLVITDYTDPTDAGDEAASNLDELEAVLGPITVTTTDTSVTYWADGGTNKLFELTLDPNDPENYTFEVFQDAPLVFSLLDFSELVAGGPQETLTVATEIGTKATFDGVFYSSSSAGNILGARINPGDPDPSVDLNPNTIGFGIKAEHASNLDNFEGWFVKFTEDDGTTPKSVDGLQFQLDQQGNTDDVTVAFGVQGTGISAITDFASADGFAYEWGQTGSSTDFVSGYFFTELPGGNNEIIVTIIEDDLFDDYVANDKQANEIVIAVDGEILEAEFKHTYNETNGNGDPIFDQFEANDSTRVKDIVVIEQAEAPDVELAFEVQGTDGDGDTTGLETFTVGVDGDDDDVITV